MSGSVGVIGAGAWGSALAMKAAAAGRPVVLWARQAAIAAVIEETRFNPLYLPDVVFDPLIRATTDLALVAAADVVLLVVPAQHLRALCRALAPLLAPGRPLVLCAKGIELATGSLMSEVAAAELPRTPLAILSGPTFAAEVARGLPTAVTLACRDATLGERLIQMLGRPSFRPYLSPDLVGTEIGGAVKNVLAIACGIVVGRRLGDNARAALITRGLAEMIRLGQAKGAARETLMGLSGLGDLVLTCTGTQSRNLSLGMALGRGEPQAGPLSARRAVVEGVPTAAAVVALARRLAVEMPICAAIDAILNRGADIQSCIAALLARPFTTEAADRALGP